MLYLWVSLYLVRNKVAQVAYFEAVPMVKIRQRGNDDFGMYYNCLI